MAGPNQVPGPTAIRAPTPSIDNHQVVLTQLKETTETAQRLRGNPNESYVKLGELINAGIINFIGGVVSPGKAIGSGGGGSYTPPVRTKGDIFTFSTVPDRLGVGSDGEVLTADSTASKGLSWQTPASGGIEPYNLTPDTHLAVPTGIGVGPNDEFEYGSTIDTTGVRYSGATAWTVASAGVGYSTQIIDGSLQVDGTTGTYAAIQAAPSAPWTVAARLTASHFNSAAYDNAGLVAYNSSNGNAFIWGPIVNGPGFLAQHNTAWVYVANPYLAGPAPFTLSFGGNIYFSTLYVAINNDGSNLNFQYSLSGYPGTYFTIYSEPISTFMGAVTHFGIYQQSSGQTNFDWFRRIA